MKVEQVSFDGEGFAAKGRPHADVRHRIKSLAVDPRPCEVHAVARDKVVIAAQVDCRNSVAMSVTAAAARRAGEAEYAAKQPLRLADFARLDQCPDLAAGNRNAAHQHHGISLHLEATLRPQ